MFARLRGLYVMKVKVRGKRISIKLDPKNAADQAFGDEYMRMMREACKSEPNPAPLTPKPRKRSKRA